MSPETARPRRRVIDILAITAGSGLAAWLAGRAVGAVAGDRNAPWIVGRASGIAAYLLLVALVVLGLLLSHPRRTRWRRPGPELRLRSHVGLAVCTCALLVLHVIVLATDKYARVGWWGALLPMASGYRPAAVTLGVLGAYCGLATGLTAALAGRLARRVWWPLHKAAVAALVLVWAHGVLAGSDSAALRLMYLATAAGVLLLALTRYAAGTPADRLREPAGGRRPRRGTSG
jgi:sulfoxide reductase heme-binding subunit YedZ